MAQIEDVKLHTTPGGTHYIWMVEFNCIYYLFIFLNCVSSLLYLFMCCQGVSYEDCKINLFNGINQNNLIFLCNHDKTNTINTIC